MCSERFLLSLISSKIFCLWVVRINDTRISQFKCHSNRLCPDHFRPFLKTLRPLLRNLERFPSQLITLHLLHARSHSPTDSGPYCRHKTITTSCISHSSSSVLIVTQGEYQVLPSLNKVSTPIRSTWVLMAQLTLARFTKFLFYPYIESVELLRWSKGYTFWCPFCLNLSSKLSS